MAFNNIVNGDPFDATKAMQNWRNVNYGSTLLPVNSSGAAVNATIDLGSSSNAFKDGFFSGKVRSQQFYFLADSGSAMNSGNITNLVQVTNTAGFVLNSGKITFTEPGVYSIAISCRMSVSSLEASLDIRQYSEAGAATRDLNICSGNDLFASNQSGAAILKVTAGEYIFIEYYSVAANIQVSQITVSIMGWPS